MTFKVTPRQAREAIIGTQLDRAAASISAAILERSDQLVPKDTSALANSGRVLRRGSGKYAIKYGSSRVPYARIHELGGMTGRNYTTKITAKHYLRDGGDSVTRGDVGRYFKGISI